MSLPFLAVLMALAVVVVIGVSRVLRVRGGLDSRTDGWRLWLLILGVIAGPPAALALFAGQGAVRGQSPGLEAALIYLVSLGLLAVGMRIAGALVRRFAPASVRPTLLLALLGREPSADVPFDPPMTPELAASVARVDERNEAFPRGWAFTQQPLLPGFEAAWATLDAATQELEAMIAARTAAGTGVAVAASRTALDARNRLETLRRAAAAGGQVWAS